jgi:argininosuccinate lyase
MPQKKNPDVAELIRGKSGRLYGNLVAVLTTMKGLPLTYNSDMQEDKEPFFDSVDTLAAVFEVLPPMLSSLTFHTDRLRQAAGEHFATATDLADYLVRKGLPFREAHEVVGRVVRHAVSVDARLEALDLTTLKGFSPLFEADVAAAITLDASLAARGTTGGTAPAAVRRSLELARRLVNPG